MADQNKLYLGTNKDTYIAADEAGNIVFQHEAGSRAVVDTEGVKFAAQGAELAAVGGSQYISDTIQQQVISGLFAEDYFNHPLTTMRITNGWFNNSHDEIALVFEFDQSAVPSTTDFTNTMIRLFGKSDWGYPPKEFTLNEGILNYSAPILYQGSDTGATASLGNAATGDDALNVGLSPGTIITQSNPIITNTGSDFKLYVFFNVPGNPIGAGGDYIWPPSGEASTPPELLNNFGSSDSITLETVPYQERLDITALNISMANLPTEEPLVSGMLWNLNGVIRISR